jgi:hypothetical protein
MKAVAKTHFRCACGAETDTPLAQGWDVPLDGTPAKCAKCKSK